MLEVDVINCTVICHITYTFFTLNVNESLLLVDGLLADFDINDKFFNAAVLATFSTLQKSVIKNAQFLFLCNHQKGTLWTYSTFSRITQKIQATDILHWPALVTVIVSFQKIFSLKKIFTYFFQYLRKSKKKQNKTEAATRGVL